MIITSFSKKHAGLDLNGASDSELRKKADELDLKYEFSAGRGRLIDIIYKKDCSVKTSGAGIPRESSG